MNLGASVLIVDDEPDVREIVAAGLKAAGFDVATASDGARAVDLIRSSRFQVAIVDLYMPGLSGLETARRLRELAPDTEIIICTGRPSLETAIESIRESVFDYICKPVTTGELRRAVHSAVERQRMRAMGMQPRPVSPKVRPEPIPPPEPPVLVGESRAMMLVRQMIHEVARSDMTVLIRGETGTGKDLVAQLIHHVSGRDARGVFIKVNCPAIPESLLESELFGHEPGAFTGAQRRKPGRFEMAGGGTVFLDEIGVIPAAAQAKLLQAIESRQFTRLGGNETISVGARFLAATNEPLERDIESGRFRPDLFYRLNEFCITLPPLRQRAEDIPLLVEHFLGKHRNSVEDGNPVVSPATMALVVGYEWPGNVRELETAVKRFALSGNEDCIRQAVQGGRTGERGGRASRRLRETEAQTIVTALTEAKWNQRRAAELLGISYSSLRRKMAKYDIKS